MEGSTLRVRDGGGERINQLERKIEKGGTGDELTQEIAIKGARLYRSRIFYQIDASSS